MGARNGYFAGAFDMFNVGDLDAVLQAKTHCDHLTIGVLTDDAVLLSRGTPAVISFAERLEIVSHVRFADRVVRHEDVDPHIAYGATVVFVEAPDSQTPSPDVQLHVLESLRMTESWMVRMAIAPSSDSSVA